jgi:hypothetical protein
MHHKIIARDRQMENQRISFFDVVQTLAVFIAVPVALLYPVGFFALFAQFVNYFFLDLYTAWYAASLVNRMVAIEQGVTILALALVAGVILSAIIAGRLLAHDKSIVPSGDESRSGPPDELPTVRAKLKAAFTLSGFERRGALYAELVGISLVILLLYSAYSRTVAAGRPSLFALRGRLSTECNPDKVTWHQVELWPDALVPALLFLVGCLWGGGLIYSSYQAHRRKTYPNRHRYPPAERRLGNAIFGGVTEGWILSGLAVAYLFSVFASIALAWNTPAFMPYMTYGPTVEHHGEPKPTDNAFLSHTEGQWYFLHRIEKDTDENPKTWKPPDFTIVSLADGQVKHVRVRPNPPKASRVAPLLGVLGEEPLEKHPCKQGIT